MKQAAFNSILDEHDIGWNDKVTLKILNPNYKCKWYDPFNWFGQPKILTFNGYLDYCKNDDCVKLNIPAKNLLEELSAPAEFYMVFDFDSILWVNCENEN